MRPQAYSAPGLMQPAFVQPGLVQSGLRSGMGLWTTAPHDHGPFTVLRKAAQGAGAGFLVLSGLGALTPESAGVAKAAPSLASFDLTNFDGLTSALFSGAFNDPLQIIGAALVFIAAGRCIARFFGLAAALLVFFLYIKGASVGDLAVLAGSVAERFAAALTAFMEPSLVSTPK